MDKIVITGIRAHGFHGVLPQEKVAGQDFIVDCELFLNLTQAINKDDLSKSVDYAEISLLIKEKIVKERFNLIETLAGAIADTILKRFRKVQRVLVTVHKPDAPIPAEFLDVAVTIERKR